MVSRRTTISHSNGRRRLRLRKGRTSSRTKKRQYVVISIIKCNTNAVSQTCATSLCRISLHTYHNRYYSHAIGTDSNNTWKQVVNTNSFRLAPQTMRPHTDNGILTCQCLRGANSCLAHGEASQWIPQTEEGDWSSGYYTLTARPKAVTNTTPVTKAHIPRAEDHSLTKSTTYEVA